MATQRLGGPYSNFSSAPFVEPDAGSRSIGQLLCLDRVSVMPARSCSKLGTARREPLVKRRAYVLRLGVGFAFEVRLSGGGHNSTLLVTGCNGLGRDVG